DRYVEVQDLFPLAQLAVERDRGIVALIRLHEDHIGAARRRNGLQLFDESRRYTAATMRFGDSQIVDIDLAALSLELAQFISSETSNQGALINRDKSDEVVAAQQVAQVVRARLCSSINILLAEDVAEQVQHCRHQAQIVRQQTSDRKRRRVGHSRAVSAGAGVAGCGRSVDAASCSVGESASVTGPVM